MAMLDAAITIYNPAKTTVLVSDVITAAGGDNSPIYGLTYEDTPDGCGAGSLNVGLYYDQFFDLGYWDQLNLVEISSGDCELVDATAATGSGNLKCYLDSVWPFDPARGEDSQIAYLNDGVNKTMRCPLESLGFDNAPGITHGSSITLSSAATSITRSITWTPTAGHTLIAILSTNHVSTTGPSGWTLGGQTSNAGLFLQMWYKTATGSETSVSVSFGSAQTATLVVLEVANGGVPSFHEDATPGTQIGPALKSPISSTQPIGSLLLSIFAIENGANMAGPYGWNTQTMGNPNPSSAINYALAYYAVSATDTNPYQAFASWSTYGTSNLGGLAALIVIAPTLTPVPWILIGQPLGGGGIPAYGPGTIVGRRRYIGQIVKRTRKNTKQPNGTITLTGLAGVLQNAIGTFLVAYTTNKDVGSLCYTALLQFATSHFPFLSIPSSPGATSEYLFPATGSTYSGNQTKITLDQFIAYVVQAIVNGDQWNLRIGHDATPRLQKYYDGASNVYVFNLTLNQSAWSFAALEVEVTDEDTSTMYNAVEVVGSNDIANGSTISAIVLDTTQITALGYQIDGSPQYNNACRSVLACEDQAQALLDQNAIAASSQTCTIYTHDDVVVSSTAPGGVQRGDIARGGAFLTVTGFPGDAPNIDGLVLSAVTTLDFQKMESQQDLSFQAIVPDYATAAREAANALATSLAANGNPGAGLDQYFVGSNAFAWSIAGFVVTPPSFEAVFALGSNPVVCGASTFTLTASANNYVWLNPDASWTVKVNDVSPVTGSIPYAEFWTDATSVVGSQPRAQTGLLGIPNSYFYEGSLITPTIAGTPTFTITPGKITSQISVEFEATNQPTDGSLAKIIAYYRQSGQPTWLQLATSPPRNTTVGSDGNGAQLTGGATSATGTYTFVLPEAANGVTFQFGFSYESNRGSESAQTSLGTAVKSNGVPSGASLSFGTVTQTIITSGATTQTVQFSVPYTVSGTSDMSWLDHINICWTYDDPGFSYPLQVIHQIPTSGAGTTGTLSFTLIFSQNSTGTDTYQYLLFGLFIAVDGSELGLLTAAICSFVHA